MIGMKNTINHQTEHQKQLTLTLPTTPCPRSNRHLNRSRRLRRAAAWFNHMRNVVDLAPDPVAAPEPVEGDGRNGTHVARPSKSVNKASEISKAA